MTAIHVDKSGSDISTDSWTLLDDDLVREDQKLEHTSDSNDEIIKIDPEIEEKSKEVEEGPKKESSDGFLTFDEFLQERLLDQDYEHAEKPQKSRKLLKGRSKKGARKCKAQNLGISVFITIILALTAFATLCSTLSQPPIEKEPEGAVRGNVPIKPKASKHNEDILKQVNDTLKEIEEMKGLKLLEEMEGKIRNRTQQQCPRATGSMPRPKIFGPPLKPSQEVPSKSSNFPSDFVKNFLNKQNKMKPKNVKTKWMLLKELLLDTNLHALVSLIMTNIYLFTLLAEFSRRPLHRNCYPKYRFKQQLDIETRESMEEVRKYLFKELPFWNEDFAEKAPKKKKIATKSSCTTKSIDTLPNRFDNLTFFADVKKTDSILFRSCPFLAKKPSVHPLVCVSSEENGKTECQRRFDELDSCQKKFETLRQTQRNKIKLLKQKFKNEVSYIRDTEEESEARAEKINLTSQKFIRKLKYNREKFLVELRKVKELRQKVAESKKKDSAKSVGTESYSVTLPPVYNFGEKFRLIKEKFEREKGQLPKKWNFQ